MEAEITNACKDGRIAGVVLLASNKSGSFSYRKSFGVRTLDPAIAPPGAGPPLEFDTLMRIASASKLVTTVAALQCVDRGLVELDDDIRQHDPDLADIKVLTGFDANDKPILVHPTEKLTLRRLLSHNSGFAYDTLSPWLLKWRKSRGEKPSPSGPKLTDRFLYPLDSEPGTEWVYSPSIDWAGRIVEQVAKQSLEDFIQSNIVRPLGLKKTTFFPQKHPELLYGHADMTVRDKASGKAVHSAEKYWSEDPDEAFGGMALYTAAEDFFKVLLSLLRNDDKLLSTRMVKEMLSPQLTPSSKDSLKRFLSKPEHEALGMGGFFPAASERDHSLAGMYLVEDLPVKMTPRRPGTSAWMGMPNFYWFIDPASELCAVFGAQLKPSDDVPVQKLAALFERTMYERMHSGA